MSVNVSNILKLLMEYSNVNLNIDDIEPNSVEITIAIKLYEYMKNLILYNKSCYSDNEELECDSDTNIDDSDNDSNFDFINEETESESDPEVTFEYMTKVVEYHREYPKHKFKTLQSKFRRLKRPQHLTRFKQYVDKRGTKKQKLIEICKFFWERFKNAREKLLAVHDRDLQRWWRIKANELNIEFKASKTFLQNLKTKFRISSRRIKKFVSKNFVRDQVKIKTDAFNFRSDIINAMPQYNR